MKAYHGTTFDKLEQMMKTGRVGIGSKYAFFTSDKTFACEFAKRRRIGRGNKPVIVTVDLDEDMVSNYDRDLYKTKERPEILQIDFIDLKTDCRVI